MNATRFLNVWRPRLHAVAATVGFSADSGPAPPEFPHRLASTITGRIRVIEAYLTHAETALQRKELA